LEFHLARHARRPKPAVSLRHARRAGQRPKLTTGWNLAIIVGSPVAPVAMVLIMLGWQATRYLWGSDDFGRPSRLPHRRRCVPEWRRLREQFGRYVGEDVARRALQHDTETGGQERDVAVLFVDLVGSTALVTSQRPGEVVKLLNQFFQVVVDVIHRHGGFI